MTNYHEKTKEELINELMKLQQEYDLFKASYDDNITGALPENDLLQQTRQNYETFFNTIDDLLFVLDEQGNIIHTNSTVIDRLGYSREELSGKSVLMVHPQERREEAGCIVGEMLNGTAKFCPVPVITKSGVQIPVETRVSQGFWNNKPAIFGVTKDISKVQLSEEKFSKVFYLNPSACGLSDLDTGKYVELNEAFYTLLGFNKDEVIGNTALDLGILNAETIESVLKKADNNGKVSNAEADLKTKSGEIKHVLLSAENIYVQNKKFRYTVVNDITERKQSEALIKLKNEELLKINSEKDKFFSIIAHDLRSPFNGFLGLTQIMAEELSSLTMAEIQDISIEMRSSAINLYRLLNNLLEWSQIQKGSVPFIAIAIPLRSFAEESIAIVIEYAKVKEIEILIDIPDNVEVIADMHMFQTILRNLVSNAVKFTHKGGKVSLSARPNIDNIVEISVNDTGIGMSETVIENLFRIDAKDILKGTDGEPGTGLGLLLCQEFIKKHNGNIWVESKLGIGSTFYFSLSGSPTPTPTL